VLCLRRNDRSLAHPMTLRPEQAEGQSAAQVGLQIEDILDIGVGGEEAPGRPL